MTYIDAKHVAAELKRRLTAEFPGVKFSVRCGRGTGCAGIDVTWTDGPATRDVGAIAYPMQGSRWNGYDERYDRTNNTVTVTIDGKRVTGDPVVNSMSVDRKVSGEVTAEATVLWHAANGDDAATRAMNGGFDCEGEFISGGWGTNQVREIAEKVTLPRRWKAARKTAQAKPQAPAAPAATAPAPPVGEGVAVQHTDAEGITATGTSRGDGSAPVLKGEGFKWHRASGYWYLPGTRGEAGAARLAAVLDALRAGGLVLAEPADAEESPAIEPAPAVEAPAAIEELPAVEPIPAPVEEAAPAEELPAVEEPTEQQRRSLESGAHHIFNTGQDIGGPGMAYAFECTVCHQRARLVEFDALPCTEEAETAFLLVVAARLLDDVMLREATAFQVVSSLPDAAPLQTREEATRFLAAQLQYGATHQWYEGELRLSTGERTTAYIKPAPAPQPAASTAPETYRGVPVPPDAITWSHERLMTWCAGADAALAYAFPPAPGE